MDRRAAPIVSTPNIDTLVLKIVERNRLVSLSSYVDYVYAIIVACLNVGSEF
jgi:hypothetical protein